MSPLVAALTREALPYFVSACAITALAHAYIYLRLRPLTQRSRLLRAVVSTLSTLLPLGMLQLSFMVIVPRALAAPLMWLCFGYLGALYIALVALLAEHALAALRKGRRAFGPFAAVALGVWGYGTWQALRPPAVTEHAIALPGWPVARDGYRIAHVSDLHIGPTIGAAQVAQWVEAINATQPNLIVLSGDLLDGSVAALGDIVRGLAGLRAPDGVFAVLGNHEYFSDADAWAAFLPRAGLRLLRNDCARFGDFALAGLDELSAREFRDHEGSGPDYTRALAACAGTTPVIVSVHQPIASRPLGEHGIALQLSGHTHGGQIAPLGLLAAADQGCVEGLCALPTHLLHVTPGLGYWGPPLRLGSRAEVSVLMLHPAEGSGTP